MSECTCHKNYTLDTLIPQVGVITDIHEETPDVKTFCVTAPDGGKLFEQPVELRDFLPTFIELAGGAIPPDMDGKSLLKLVQGQESEWRKYLDMEHATCYSQDNYWCALTDGKIKYVWNFHTGKEELFDLRKDPNELVECSGKPAYATQLKEMRQAMVDHLAERDETFVKDGKLVVRETTMLYSPNYPQTK